MRRSMTSVRYNTLVTLRNEGWQWKDIAEKLSVSMSSLRRCWNSEEDIKVKHRRATPKQGKKLGTVNRALSAAIGNTDRMQAKLASLLTDLRNRGIASLTLDADTGEAKIVEVKTVKVQP